MPVLIISEPGAFGHQERGAVVGRLGHPRSRIPLWAGTDCQTPEDGVWHVQVPRRSSCHEKRRQRARPCGASKARWKGRRSSVCPSPTAPNCRTSKRSGTTAGLVFSTPCRQRTNTSTTKPNCIAINSISFASPTVFTSAVERSFPQNGIVPFRRHDPVVRKVTKTSWKITACRGNPSSAFLCGLFRDFGVKRTGGGVQPDRLFHA